MVDGAMASASTRSAIHGFSTSVTIIRRGKMDKVWLVWQGEYSDARVIAVFDNERDAEIHAAMVDDDCYTQSFEVGKVKYNKDKEIGYKIEMLYSDNEYRWYSINGYFAYKVGKNRPRVNVVTVTKYGVNCYYKVNVIADSKEKALKKASDFIAKYRAEKLGL
jgi:hypothetical protein